MPKKNDNENALPDGFEPLARRSVDGWFVLEEGNTVQGFFRGSFNVPSQFSRKGKNVFKIELTAGGKTKALIENGEEATMDEGDFVGLDEKGWLAALNDVPEGREVFVRCKGKGVAKKGQSAPWIFDLGVVPI